MATESTTETKKKAAETAAESKAEEGTGAPEPTTKLATAKQAAAKPSADDGEVATRDESRAAEPVEFADDFEDTAAGSRTGLGAGAGAIVSAALGLVSLSGTSLSDQMQARKQLMGQIQSQMGGGGGDQIQAMYGGPWHMTALFNGMFALVAVIVGGALVAALGSRGRTGGWARPVALGGLILGVIGLLVSGGMFFDLFAPAPKIPGQ